MRKAIILTCLLLATTACKVDPSGKPEAEKSTAAREQSGDLQDAMSAQDGTAAAAQDTPRPIMQLQVVLDRLGFSSGVIDGRDSERTRHAIAGFQEAQGLTVSGALDDPTKAALARWNGIPATRTVTIPEHFAQGPFAPLPKSAADQAKLTGMSYETLDEKLAERFHTSVETLRALNPAPSAAQSGGSATPAPSAAAVPSQAAMAAPLFRAGQTIRVPNVGADRVARGAVEDAAWQNTLVTLGVGAEQPRADSITVSKANRTLKAFDADGRLIAIFTATIGSSHDPLPLGRWKINGVARNPKFHYNPELFWDVSDSHDDQMLPPGPNSPVGVVWIDLSKDHYGIHGTPTPDSIGRAESHGCVRLTNWDAARLAQMVRPGTKVLFEA